MKIELGNGFAIELAEDSLDDIDIFESLVEIQRGNVSLLPDTARRLIGDDGYRRLKDSCRDEKGKAKTSDVVAALGEILKRAGEGKKN